MRGLMIAAATIGLLASAGAAFAAEQTEGTVRSVNANTGTLTLRSGQTYTFQDSSVLLGIMPGDYVGVTYTGQDRGIGAFNPDPAN